MSTPRLGASGTAGTGFVTLLIVMTLALAAYFMLVTLVPLTVVDLGVQAHLLGALASLGFLSPLLLAIAVGRTVDRFGPKPVLVLGTAVLAVVVTPSVMGVSLLALTGLQAVVGLMQVLVILSGQALAASLGEDRERLKRMGFFTLSIAGGQLLGPPVAGIVFDYAGPQASFAVAALTTLVASAVALLLPGARTPSTTEASARDQPPSVHPMRFLQAPTFATALLASGTVLLCIGLIHTFLPLRLSALPNPGTVVGTMLGVMALTSIAVRPFVSQIAARLGGNQIALLNVALVVLLGTIVVGSTVSIAAVAVAVALIGIGSGISQPLSIVMVLEDRPRAQHGVALGVRISGNRLAQLIGPVAVGATTSLIGLGPAMIGAACVLALPIGAARWLVRRRKEQS